MQEVFEELKNKVEPWEPSDWQGTWLQHLSPNQRKFHSCKYIWAHVENTLLCQECGKFHHKKFRVINTQTERGTVQHYDLPSVFLCNKCEKKYQ